MPWRPFGLPCPIQPRPKWIWRQVRSAIDAMHDALWTPKDFVGYDHVTERVMDVLYAAQPDLSEAPGPSGESWRWPGHTG